MRWLLLMSVACCATDFAIIAGFSTVHDAGSDSPRYPLFETLPVGSSTAYTVQVPPGAESEITACAVGPDGTTLFIGSSFQADQTLATAFRGSVVSTTVTAISIPPLPFSNLYAVAFGPDGTAFLGGQIDGAPLVYTLAPGASTVTPITIPSGDMGEIDAIAVAPDGTAILVGVNRNSSTPLVYTISSGDTSVTPVLDSSSPPTGDLLTVAVSSGGLVAMGGRDTMSNTALIYTMTAPYTSPVQITVSDAGGQIDDLAFAPDGSAVLVGSAYGGALIYGLRDNAAYSIVPEYEYNERLNCVCIGSDGTAIIGGGANYISGGPPLFYRVPLGSTVATLINPPNDDPGYIIACAIGPENIAVLVGVNQNQATNSIYTIPTSGETVSIISNTAQPSESASLGVAIYTYAALYDPNRLAPFYNLQQYNTINKLNQAGIP